MKLILSLYSQEFFLFSSIPPLEGSRKTTVSSNLLEVVFVFVDQVQNAQKMKKTNSPTG
jgi:hypothetical protein